MHKESKVLDDLSKENPLFFKNKEHIATLIENDQLKTHKMFGGLPITEILTAFRANKKLNIIQNVEPKMDFLLASGEKKHHAAPLFPEIGLTYSLLEINQGNLGDCYFLAAIATLLADEHGSAVIQSCMRDLQELVAPGLTLGKLLGFSDDRKVMVRFFKEGQAHYAVVDKSEFVSNRRAQSPLYIQILEKAWAGMFCQGKMSVLDKGGSSNDVLRAFLGCEKDFAISMVGDLWDKKNQELLNLFSESGYALKKSLGEVFGNNQELIALFKEVRAPLMELLEKSTSHETFRQSMLDYFKQLPLTDSFKDDPVKKGHLGEILTCLTERVDALKSKQAFCTYYEKLLFAELQDVAKRGFPLTYGTDDFVSQTRAVGFAGEHKRDGIAGKHRYAILATAAFIFEEKSVPGMKLYNPWGYGKGSSGYGRIYTTDKVSGELKAQASQNSTFCMNLADAMKTGSIFYVATPVLKKDAESMRAYVSHVGQTAVSSIHSRLDEFKPAPSKTSLFKQSKDHTGGGEPASLSTGFISGR